MQADCNSRPADQHRPELANGRDELNTCEFSLFLPAAPREPIKEYIIEAPPQWDDERQQIVNRRVTILPSLKRGFPTYFDSRVMTAIVSLAREHNQFSSPRVSFTRYKIAQLLQLSHDGRTYQRLYESLERLMHTIYRVDNAWWNNKRKVRESSYSFSIIDSLYCVHGRAVADGDEDPVEAGSYFTFGEKVFESLNSGYVTRVDFNELNQLETYVGHQMYRLATKRFFHSPKFSIDLDQLFHFNLGLTGKCDAGIMKQRLAKGFKELERLQKIKPLPASKRFQKKAERGKWNVHFEQGRVSEETPTAAEAPADPLAAKLIARGITKRTAAKLVAAHDAAKIEFQIELFDSKRAQKLPMKNPAGFLKNAIEDEHAAPADFKTVAEREAGQVKTKKAMAHRKKQQAQRDAKQHAEHAADWQRTCDYLDSLSDVERAAVERAAMEGDSFGLARKYLRDRAAGGLNEMAFQNALTRHVLSVLATGQTL